MDDECFLKAVIEVCKVTKELYPGTNLIAILRERSIDLRKQKISSFPKLPPAKPVLADGKSLTEAFDEEVKKLAKEKSV